MPLLLQRSRDGGSTGDVIILEQGTNTKPTKPPCLLQPHLGGISPLGAQSLATTSLSREPRSPSTPGCPPGIFASLEKAL